MNWGAIQFSIDLLPQNPAPYSPKIDVYRTNSRPQKKEKGNCFLVPQAILTIPRQPWTLLDLKNIEKTDFFFRPGQPAPGLGSQTVLTGPA